MIITILGARPQFIKAAALSKAFKEHGIEERIIHTGQHYDEKMSDVFFRELNIPGVFKNLNIGSSGHGNQTGQMMIEIENEILNSEKKVDAIVVYGDTNSTLAGALCASKMHIPVIHVEAGLRSYNRTMPEEINRVITDHISSILFCSSQEGINNLLEEGINKNVYNVGDIMQDSVNAFLPFAKKPALPEIETILNSTFNLITIHRPANTDDIEKLQEILNGIEKIKDNCIWPVHPRNNASLSKLSIPENLFLIAPLSYFEMLYCISKSNKIITDSGGLQKEAYWLKKPCITVRPETEWVETLENNWNQLCDVNADKLSKCYFQNPIFSDWKPLYGEGNSAKEIVKIIKANI